MSDPTSSPAPSGAVNASSDPFRKPSRRSIVVGAAWAVPAVVAVKATPAWAAMSPTPCLAYTYQQVRAASQFLSGTLLGTRLSQVFLDPSWTPFSLAELRGLQVTTIPPNAPVPDPAPPISTRIDSVANGPAYRMPLNLNALNLVDVIAGVKLGSLIKTDLGAINEWAQAIYNGYALGSTGAIDNSSGMIDTSQAANSTTWASVNLKNLLDNALSGGLSGVGTWVSNIADLSLDVGAIAARAREEECTNCIKRDYLLAWLKLALKSPLIKGIYNVLDPILFGTPGLVSTLNGLIGPGSVLDNLLNTIETAIAALTLGTLRANATISLSLDVTELRNRLRTDVFPGTKLLDLKLGDGTQPGDNVLFIDLGVLLGGAYGTPNVGNTALNNLPANSDLLINASAVDNLVTELGKIGANVLEILYDLLQVDINVTVEGWSLLNGTWYTVATLALVNKTTNAGPVSLRTLFDGDATFKVTLDPTHGGLIGGLLGLLTNLVTTTLNATLKTIGLTLKTLVHDQVLTTTLQAAIDALTGFVSALLKWLFVNPGVLSLTANAQNDPSAGCSVTPGYKPEPPDWSSITTGEYDVAALRLSVLQSVSTKLVTLYLARAAVGPIIATPNPTNP